MTRSLRPGRILAIAQLALSLLLIVGAGSSCAALQKLTGQDAGRLRESVLILRVEPRGSDQRGISGTTERLDRTYRELIRRTLDIPGVQQASMANTTPTAPISSGGAMIPLPSGERQRIPMLMVYPNYSRRSALRSSADATSGLAISANTRLPCASSTSRSRSFSIRVRSGRAALLHRPSRAVVEPRTAGSQRAVSDRRSGQGLALQQSQRRGPPRHVSDVSPANTGRGQMQLHVRVAGNAGVVLQRIREEVAALDPSMPMFDVHTLAEEMNAALVQQRLIAMLSTVFGGLALCSPAWGCTGCWRFRWCSAPAKSASGWRSAHVAPMWCGWSCEKR